MSKWLPDARPSDRAADVAARAIHRRLTLVRRFLKRSVKHPGEPEPVHQLRVWCRRSEAALAMYADLLSDRQRQRMRKTLRRLRRAAGAIRDCDVFAEREGKWTARLSRERADAQAALERRYRKLDRGDKLKRRAARLSRDLRRRHAQRTELFVDRARTAVRHALGRFLEAAPTDLTDEPTLHRFRIRGKRLRYIMELTAGAFPASFREDLYPLFGTLQERLGQLNDLTEARNRLADLRVDRPDAKVQDAHWQRHQRIEDELRQAREAFAHWWAPEVQADLQARFREFVGQGIE